MFLKETLVVCRHWLLTAFSSVTEIAKQPARTVLHGLKARYGLFDTFVV